MKRFHVYVTLVFDEPYEESEIMHYDNQEDYERSTIEYIKDELWSDRIANGPIEFSDVEVIILDDNPLIV